MAGQKRQECCALQQCLAQACRAGLNFRVGLTFSPQSVDSPELSQMEVPPAPRRRRERGAEKPSRRASVAEFQSNILELFLGRLWSVELCFYQAAGSFNKIFMAGKVLFMEIRLLKCLLGGGPHQLAFLPTASLFPCRMASPSSSFFPLPTGPELPGKLELCLQKSREPWRVGGTEGVWWVLKAVLHSCPCSLPCHHPLEGPWAKPFRTQLYSAPGALCQELLKVWHSHIAQPPSTSRYLLPCSAAFRAFLPTSPEPRGFT